MEVLRCLSKHHLLGRASSTTHGRRCPRTSRLPQLVSYATITPMTRDQALQQLKDGNKRHASAAHRSPRRDAIRRTALASGQKPWGAVLGCSDSRVPPEIVFDQGLGDLFVVRTAGHVCDATVTASLGYAVQHLRVPLVLVLGHCGCGAVNAAIAHRPEEPDDCLCTAIRPAIEKARLCEGDLCDQAVRLHVEGMVEYLRHALSLPEDGGAAVVGGVYDLASGLVEFLAPAVLSPDPPPGS